MTGYGENGTGDANDVWRVTVAGAKLGSDVTAVTSKLKFVHYLQSCILTTSGKQLPKWGYEQQEVTCNPNLRDQNALWNVEENIFEKRKSIVWQMTRYNLQPYMIFPVSVCASFFIESLA